MTDKIIKEHSTELFILELNYTLKQILKQRFQIRLALFTVQYSTQYSTVQYSTVQYSTVQLPVSFTGSTGLY